MTQQQYLYWSSQNPVFDTPKTIKKPNPGLHRLGFFVPAVNSHPTRTKASSYTSTHKPSPVMKQFVAPQAAIIAPMEAVKTTI
jgi:hypothetical protein